MDEYKLAKANRMKRTDRTTGRRGKGRMKISGRGLKVLANIGITAGPTVLVQTPKGTKKVRTRASR